MKRAAVTAGIILFLSIVLKAQEGTDDSIRYIFGLPIVEEADSTPVSGDRAPKDVLIKVPRQKIPDQLKKTLEEDKVYNGWEKFPLYQSRNTKLYILTIREGNTTRTYGFNEKGKLITLSETTEQE